MSTNRLFPATEETLFNLSSEDEAQLTKLNTDLDKLDAEWQLLSLKMQEIQKQKHAIRFHEDVELKNLLAEKIPGKNINCFVDRVKNKILIYADQCAGSHEKDKLKKIFHEMTGQVPQLIVGHYKTADFQKFVPNDDEKVTYIFELKHRSILMSGAKSYTLGNAYSAYWN